MIGTIIHEVVNRPRPHGLIQLKRRSRRKPKVQEGTQQKIYARWIKAEIDQEGACLELPFTLMLLLSFALLSISYIGQDTISILESAIFLDITENANFAWAYNFGHKGIDDVNSYADFWSWSRLGFVPLVVPSAPWGYSEGLGEAVPPSADGSAPAYDTGLLPTRRPMPGYRRPTPIKNDYLRYNRIIGGIRFRQQVANASYENCIHPGSAGVFKDFIGKGCTEPSEEELNPDYYATEIMLEPGREEWLLSEVVSWESLIQHLIDMEDGCYSAHAQNRTCLCSSCAELMNPWIDELTKRAEISFLVYNAQYGVHCMATVNFWFNRAGHIHKRVNMRSSWAGVEVRSAGTIFVFLAAGMVWVFSNIYVFRTEGTEIYEVIQRTNKPWFLSVTEDYISFWNCVDWISVGIALAVCMLFFQLMLQTYKVNAGLAELAMTSMTTNSTNLNPVLYQETIQTYYGDVSELFQRERLFRLWICIYPMVLMMRLFKSFAAQPRLAVVTETFKQAASDMMHFFIVFSSVYFCMSVNAVLFFGQDDINFSRLDWALFSVWRAMLGDWDWDGMRSIGREKAFIWFFLFMLVVVLILMNILISILMESYAVVKSSADNADSLFRQVWNMLRRARETRQGKRVKLNDIADALLADAEGNETAMLNNPRPLLPQFRIKLDRTEGADLGLQLDTQSTSGVLIKRITGGLAAEHNETTQLLEIRPGDMVVDVNGARHDNKEILFALKQNKVLNIRLRRPVHDMPVVLELRRGNSTVRRVSKQSRSLSKDEALRNPAFLMDMVEGIPEKQAKRTLENSQSWNDTMNGESFSPEMLEEDMYKLLERMGNSAFCAAWLRTKMQEYKALEEEHEKATAAKKRTRKERSKGATQQLRDGIQEVRLIAAERTSELAEDMASVLGEEMAVLERRQKEQQRAMVHTKDSLQGLRQMIYKLNLTCEETGSLAKQIKVRPSEKETIRITGGSGHYTSQMHFSSQVSPMSEVEDPDMLRARLLATRAARGYTEDAPLHNHRFGAAVGGSRK